MRQVLGIAVGFVLGLAGAIILVGVFEEVANLECGPSSGTGGRNAVYAAAALLGVSAFLLARRPTWRPWVTWAVGGATVAGVYVGTYVFVVLTWVGNCAS